MQELIKLAAGTLAGGFVGFVVFTWFMLFLGYPFMAFLALRHAKGIRSELAQLNETLASRLSLDRT